MEAGSLFASYKIVKKLGHRSSGDLYLGMEVAGCSYVTLLVLDEHDPLYSAREPNFKGERKAAGTFSHPAICHLYDSGKHSTNHFLAIEYVRGTTLEELLDKNVPLSDKERQKFARKVTDVVMAAHAAGVTHGGLVPSTIYYTQKGQIKVTGFGCQTAPFNPPYGFLAPERRLGGRPTPESDLYSLAGVVASLALKGFIPTDEKASLASMAQDENKSLAEKAINSSTFAQLNNELRTALALLFADDPAERDKGAPLLIECLSKANIFKPVSFRFSIEESSPSETAIKGLTPKAGSPEAEAEKAAAEAAIRALSEEEAKEPAHEIKETAVPQQDSNEEAIAKAAAEAAIMAIAEEEAVPEEKQLTEAEVQVLEEADSCYWRAQSAIFEKDFKSAIKEYRAIMAMPLATVSPLAPKVENEATMLFWHTGLKSSVAGAYPGPSPQHALEADEYIAFLQAFLPLAASFTREALCTVVERRLLETVLVAITDKKRRSHLFREALMRCRKSTWTKREYCSFLEFDGRKQEAITQRVKLAVSLADEGLITEALEEYRAAKKLSPEAKAPQRLLDVTDKAEKLKVVAEGVIGVMETSGEAALHVAEHFLSRMPANVEIMEKVASFKANQGMTQEAARLHAKATAISYNRSNRRRALENATFVLEHTPENVDALTYALDLLQREGQRPECKDLKTTAQKVLATLAVD